MLPGQRLLRRAFPNSFKEEGKAEIISDCFASADLWAHADFRRLVSCWWGSDRFTHLQ